MNDSNCSGSRKGSVPTEDEDDDDESSGDESRMTDISQDIAYGMSKPSWVITKPKSRRSTKSEADERNQSSDSIDTRPLMVSLEKFPMENSGKFGIASEMKDSNLFASAVSGESSVNDLYKI